MGKYRDMMELFGCFSVTIHAKRTVTRWMSGSKRVDPRVTMVVSLVWSSDWMVWGYPHDLGNWNYGWTWNQDGNRHVATRL